MVRILFEVSLPARTVDEVAETLSPRALGHGATGRLETVPRLGGCAGPAVGGDARWVPCWVAVEWPGTPRRDDVRLVLGRVKGMIARACSQGGLHVRVIPATAQIGEEFLRFRDVLDAADRFE